MVGLYNYAVKVKGQAVALAQNFNGFIIAVKQVLGQVYGALTEACTCQ